MTFALTNQATTGVEAGPLAELAHTAFTAVEEGRWVQVVFDLDDTLFLVRPRKQAIFRELAEAHSDELRDALHLLADSAIPYDVDEALGSVGITQSRHVTRLKEAFFARFFDGRYTRHDAPNPGAAAYVNALHARGVHVLYLSGRPIEMADQTLGTLALHGFPVNTRHTGLMLKDTHEQHLGDAEFKGVKAYEIAERGTILGVFDNEPANLNAMYPAAPDARYFLLETDRSPNAPAVEMASHTLSHFVSPQARFQAAFAATPRFGGTGWTLDVQAGA